MDQQREATNDIIARFGGLAAMARILGHASASTVQGWKERGLIPAKQQPAVLEAGQSLSPPIAHSDFFQKKSEAA